MRLYERSERGTLYGADYPYKRGTRIWHESYGPGTVIDMEKDRLLIRFDGGEAKRIVASFVVPCPTLAVSMTCH